LANTDESQPVVKGKFQQRKAQKEHETPTDRAARVTAAATLWMAVFTFFLAATSGFTVWILNNQLNAMGQDERAWVGAGNGKFVINSKELKVEFTVANVGKSPASYAVSNVAWTGKMKGENLRPADIVYPREDGQNGTIFPTQTFQLSNTLPSPTDQHQAVNADQLSKGERLLFVFGRIKYRDVFKDWHWTHFCVLVQQDLITDKPCDFYNDTDSDKHQQDGYDTATPN